jgi:hypothetical protein
MARAYLVDCEPGGMDLDEASTLGTDIVPLELNFDMHRKALSSRRLIQTPTQEIISLLSEWWLESTM